MQTCARSSLLAICEELTHWKRPWCREGLGAGGEGDDRGWDGWMASPTRWTWVWVDSGSWWWTGRPGVLRFMGSQRVEHDWATELNWADSIQAFLNKVCFYFSNVSATSDSSNRERERRNNKNTDYLAKKKKKISTKNKNWYVIIRAYIFVYFLS